MSRGTPFSEWAQEQEAKETPAQAELRRRFEAEFLNRHEISVRGHGTIWGTACIEIACTCGWSRNTSPGFTEKNPDDHGKITLINLNRVAAAHLSEARTGQ
jgi:hypothetical protein